MLTSEIGGGGLPLAGRVSMDLTGIDATEAPDVREGDDAVLIGAGQDANALAAACGTIGYEIVTGITRRVPRRYLRSGAVVATKTLADGYVEC